MDCPSVLANLVLLAGGCESFVFLPLVLGLDVPAVMLFLRFGSIR